MAANNLPHNCQNIPPTAAQQQADAADVDLSLSIALFPPPPPPPPLPPRRVIKSVIIEPPYPWSTDRRATVHTLGHLLSNGISVIPGAVQCKKCGNEYEMELGLQSAYASIQSFMAEYKDTMCHRAASIWQSPRLPKCQNCNKENSMQPMIASKKRNINWLFLFLGQLLGCCTLDQLKYFCKHTKHHRTGAKNRVLFLCYLQICRQLDPDGPYDL